MTTDFTMQANRQWSKRPQDERFTSLTEMSAYLANIRQHSKAMTMANRDLKFQPAESDPIHGLTVVGKAGIPFYPSHWAFGQLATLAGAPAGYMRKLPSPLAADCLNYGTHHVRDVEEIGLLLYKNGGDPMVRAGTGPNYGRIWSNDVVDALAARVGDGVTGDWTVPGEFGNAVTVDKQNTTLYASDRDMWVFLANEKNKIEVPDRRDGKSGPMSRGFFVWNSEVGSETVGIATFLFDYVCCNRIIWGGTQHREIKVRHTSGAPHRWAEEVFPALMAYANEGQGNILETIAAAKAKRLGKDEVTKFLATRFGPRLVPTLSKLHVQEEGRPIASLWDTVTASTAYARSIPYQDERVVFEREAGKILDLVAA